MRTAANGERGTEGRYSSPPVRRSLFSLAPMRQIPDEASLYLSRHRPVLMDAIRQESSKHGP